MRRFTFKGRLFALFVCTLAWLSVNAVKITTEGTVVTLNFNEDTNVAFSDNYGNVQNNFQNNVDGNFTIMKVVGPITANDVKAIFNMNKFDQNKGDQTLDLSQATGISLSDITGIQMKAGKIILPVGMSLPEESVYKNSGSTWNQGNLRYVCAINGDGSISVGGGAFNNRNNENAIQDAIEKNLYPFSEAEKGIKTLAGDYTAADKSAVDDFNSTRVSTTFENGVLTVAASDYPDNLAALATQYGLENITKVVLPDGSIWENNEVTGNSASVTEAAENLKNAGFEVTSSSANIGTYVKIVDGVTIVTSTAEGQMSNLSAAELAALREADELKLIGPFNNDPDFLKLGANSTPSTVDLTEAIIAEGTDSYTYYYLEEGQKNVRHQLSKDDTGWYYTQDGVRKDVEEKDVRIFTAAVSGGQKMPDGWKGTLTSISLPTNSDYNVVAADFCNGFTNLTSVTFPDNITVIGNNAFHTNSSLEEVSLPQNLVALCENAFYKSALTSVSIPGSVEIISKMAFTECEDVTKLIFEESDPDHHMIVKYYGFFNLKNLHDIYINTTAEIDCENEAFDYRITWGQGDAGSSDFCTLHFKAEVASHYANLMHPLTAEIAKDPAKFHNWLHKHFTFAANPGANGWWEFINNGTMDGPDDPGTVKGAKFLRTYSDYHYDRIVPEGVKAYIVTGLDKNEDGDYALNLVSLLVIPKRTGVILYGVSNSKDENDQPILSMSLCEIANGVPLRRDYWDYLQGDDAKYLKNYLWPSCVTLDPEGFVTERYPFYHLNEDGTVATDELGDYRIDFLHRNVLKEAEGPSEVNPYDQQSKFVTPDESEYTYAKYHGENLNGFFRNFYMSRYSTTNSGKKYKANGGDLDNNNFVGFFRAKKSSIKPGMAYLRLRSDEYKDAEGGEVVINGDTNPFVYNGETYDMKNYQVEYSKENGKPILPSVSGYWIIGGNPDMEWQLVGNWGDRSKAKAPNQPNGAKYVSLKFYGEPEIVEYENGTATMIVPSSMVETEETGDFYNLQGVKVTNPSKGIYIVNGKKVVIK